MSKRKTVLNGLLLMVALCMILAGCAPLQAKIEEYSSDKEPCSLNTEDVTQFTYKSESYTVLEDTVSNDGLGKWIGYIRQLAAVDENGKILVQENIEKASFQTLADLADSAPDAAYIIPFLNVYAAPDAASYLIVDANGGYHKAVPSDTVSEADTVFDFKALTQKTSGEFELNPDDGTQLLRNGLVYQVTSETVPSDKLGSYLAVLAEEVTFDADTKKPLTKDELNAIDWSGTGGGQREHWMYVDVYELSGRDTAEAVAVKVNNQYHLAEAQE